jgi:chromosome segregation ATPase
MKPLELLKETYKHLDDKLTYVNNDIKVLQKALDEKLDELEELDKLLDQYHEFIRKSEDAVDANSGGDPGVLSEPTPKEL